MGEPHVFTYSPAGNVVSGSWKGGWLTALRLARNHADVLLLVADRVEFHRQRLPVLTAHLAKCSMSRFPSSRPKADRRHTTQTGPCVGVPNPALLSLRSHENRSGNPSKPQRRGPGASSGGRHPRWLPTSRPPVGVHHELTLLDARETAPAALARRRHLRAQGGTDPNARLPARHSHGQSTSPSIPISGAARAAARSPRARPATPAPCRRSSKATSKTSPPVISCSTPTAGPSTA